MGLSYPCSLSELPLGGNDGAAYVPAGGVGVGKAGRAGAEPSDEGAAPEAALAAGLAGGAELSGV